jgi:hypothetical protein
MPKPYVRHDKPSRYRCVNVPQRTWELMATYAEVTGSTMTWCLEKAVQLWYEQEAVPILDVLLQRNGRKK